MRRKNETLWLILIVSVLELTRGSTEIVKDDVPPTSPMNVRLETINQTALLVKFDPMPMKIKGCFIGNKFTSSHGLYLYENVDLSNDDEKQEQEHSWVISPLNPNTEYAVVVQCYNKFGVGPISEEVKQFTAEGVPEQAPSKVRCKSLSPKTIRVSWENPAPETVNGKIIGSKVVFWFNEKFKKTHETLTGIRTTLEGLVPFTEYTIQVLAFTNGGDGVASKPINCKTEQDVPDEPAAVKAYAMSSTSLLVIWKPPTAPNGILKPYKIYVRRKDEAEPKVYEKIPRYTSHEFYGLPTNETYEVWVSASSHAGEGKKSDKITVELTDKIETKVASFEESITVKSGSNVRFPCDSVPRSVGFTWTVDKIEMDLSGKETRTPNFWCCASPGAVNSECYKSCEGSAGRYEVLPHGLLTIRDVSSDDTGEYTCTVEDSLEKDSVTHKLVVLGPPKLEISETTNDSVTVNFRKNTLESIDGFNLHYRTMPSRKWEVISLSSDTQKYTIDGLECGSNLQIYVGAYNAAGYEESSEVLNVKLKGSKPIAPENSDFITEYSSSAELDMRKWKNGGCEMSRMSVSLKKKGEAEWTKISDRVWPGANFVLLDLEQVTLYELLMETSNAIGTTKAQYKFVTLYNG